MPRLALPVRREKDEFPVIVLPWDCVMHDNHRTIPARGRRGLVAAPQYRARKAKASVVARAQWGLLPLLRGDLALDARCYFPDRRKRDAGNYRKLVTDALTGTVYADDSQLIDERWTRAGIVPRATARVEIRVSVFGRTGPDSDAVAEPRWAGAGDLLFRTADGTWGLHDLSHCSCNGPTDEIGGFRFESLDALLASCSGEYRERVQPLVDAARAQSNERPT